MNLFSVVSVCPECPAARRARRQRSYAQADKFFPKRSKWQNRVQLMRRPPPASPLNCFKPIALNFTFIESFSNRRHYPNGLVCIIITLSRRYCYVLQDVLTRHVLNSTRTISYDSVCNCKYMARATEQNLLSVR